MIFKQRYSILNGKSLELSKSQIVSDPIYQETNSVESCHKYLLDISEQQEPMIQMVVRNIANKICDNFILINEIPAMPHYMEYNDKLVVAIPNLDFNKIVYIYGGRAILNLLTRKDYPNQVLSLVSETYIRIFLKLSTKSIHQDLLKQHIAHYVYVWFFSNFSEKTMSNISLALRNNGYIIDSELLRKSFEASEKSINEVLDLISIALGTDVSTIKTKLTLQYTCDMLVGLEDLIHALTTMANAYDSKIPSSVYNVMSLDTEDEKILKRLLKTW